MCIRCIEINQLRKELTTLRAAARDVLEEVGACVGIYDGEWQIRYAGGIDDMPMKLQRLAKLSFYDRRKGVK